jgi:cytidylate kinase
LEDRIKRVCERDGISPEDAGSFIAKQERTRETYYNYFTFGNWGVASNYDLCVDSSKLGIEGTARMVIDFAARMEGNK